MEAIILHSALTYRTQELAAWKRAAPGAAAPVGAVEFGSGGPDQQPGSCPPGNGRATGAGGTGP